MSVLEVEELLREISPDAPGGEDLEYDPAFGELEREAQGTAGQQMGDAVIEGREADWKAVRKKSASLFSRTKDLRVAMLLTRAVLKTDGLPGFADGLALLRGMVDRYWQTMHPRLDPDDDNDPTLRINTLSALLDPDTFLREVRETPLVRSRAVGQFSYRDWLIAHGDLPAPADQPGPQTSTIEAAFLDCDLEELKLTGSSLAQSIDCVTAIESDITRQVGVSNAASFDTIARLLRDMQRVVSEQLERRGVRDAPEEATEELAGEPNGAAGAGGVAATVQRLTGEITTREDVLKALDKICEYYERHEPSSPVPLLLNRAKRLATKSFLEILRDLAPSGVDQAQAIGGVFSEQGD